MKAANKRKKAKKIAFSPRNLFIGILIFTVLATIIWKFYYLTQSDSAAPRPYNNFIEIKDQGSLAPPNNAKQSSDENVQQATNRQLVFSNPRAEQQDTHIVAYADLPERVTGVCKFRFQQAASVIETTSTLSNASPCGSRVAVSRFSRGGTWQVSINFTSRDGLTSATQAPFSFFISK